MKPVQLFCAQVALQQLVRIASHQSNLIFSQGETFVSRIVDEIQHQQTERQQNHTHEVDQSSLAAQLVIVGYGKNGFFCKSQEGSHNYHCKDGGTEERMKRQVAGPYGFRQPRKEKRDKSARELVGEEDHSDESDPRVQRVEIWHWRFGVVVRVKNRLQRYHG
uniref:Uncharacterized protein n=2 Tax=Photinus pyralis TaxID=7054 RepID=A0A1Y1M6U0_PHOPY